jgi:group I intron endonuclease
MAKTILSGIYRIDGPRGKFYVGSALHIPRRWIEHKRDLRRGDHANAKLQAAWNKYGESCFVLSIIEVVASKEMLIAREQHWLDATQAASRGYNLTPTAGSLLGKKHTEETRRKMSEAHKGRKHGPMSEEQKAHYSELYRGKKLSEETRARMSAAKTGRVFSDETRQRISDAHRGRSLSEATKQKLRLANLGKKASEETRAKMRAAQANRPPISEETRRRLIAAQARRKSQ